MNVIAFMQILGYIQDGNRVGTEAISMVKSRGLNSLPMYLIFGLLMI